MNILYEKVSFSSNKDLMISRSGRKLVPLNKCDKPVLELREEDDIILKAMRKELSELVLTADKISILFSKAKTQRDKWYYNDLLNSISLKIEKQEKEIRKFLINARNAQLAQLGYK